MQYTLWDNSNEIKLDCMRSTHEGIQGLKLIDFAQYHVYRYNI